MTTTVLVPGRARPRVAAEAAPEDGPLTSDDATFEIEVGGARGGGAAVETIEVPDAHVIEIELENGLILFRRIETLEGACEGAARSGAGGEMHMLPSHLDIEDTATRSVARRVAIRLYRFFTGEAVVRATVARAAEAVEGKLALPGVDALFRVASDGTLVAPGALAEGQRMAVLIHGTFSSTAGSFGDLVPVPVSDETEGDLGAVADPGHWSTLARAFPGEKEPEIYAFEHCTLTKSPVENAIALVRALPRGAVLTVLTHSRGGLVGDLLARAEREGEAFDERDRQIMTGVLEKAGGYTGAEIARQVALLEELSTLLAERQPVIERFVRVASPSRGTILASDRLDRGLSVVFNLMRLVPGPQRAFLSVLQQLAQSVAAQRADATVLPGLDAMRPRSALVAVLNRTDVRVTAPLAVVAGDTAPRGVLRGLAILATDMFYREDHDIVVETASMSAGVRRGVSVYRLMESSADIDHFSYFRNPATGNRIVRAMTGPAEQADFVPVVEAQAPMVAETSRGAGRVAPCEGPVAIVLPGIQGSQLGEANGNVVWLDPFEMGLGGIRTIGARGGTPRPDVRSMRSIPLYYNRLLRTLRLTHEVIDFHYDWRLSVAVEADRLAKMVTEVLDRTDDKKRPVRLIGHSMGGLVVRAMIQRHRDVWERMFNGRSGSRFVMLGTPNGGSVAMAWALLGRDKLLKLLETIDVTTDMPRFLEEIQPMPGALELLPTDLGGRFFDRATWEELNVDDYPLPEQAALDAAKATAASLTLAPEDRARMVYVAGKAAATPVSIEVVGTGRDRRLRLLATRNGDGRVPWRTGLLPGVRTWYAPATQHGDLCRDKRVIPAIVDLVMRGQTAQLSQTPPTSRGADTLVEVRSEDVIYPTEAEMEAAAVGGDPEAIDTSPGADVIARVTVRHGDLRSHNGTIALGHYRDTPLLSAELALDRVLGAKLMQHRDLGLYPGWINSAEMFVRDAPGFGPDGALVVGLGPFGSLSKARLVSTLTHAYMRYALHAGHATDADERRLTTLLIGHRESRLSIRDCVEAMLEALRGANRVLPPRHRITRLETLELYEDIAIAVAEALDAERNGTSWNGDLDIDAVVRTGVAGRRRAYSATGDAWDQKVRITVDREDPARFRYEVLSQSALVSEAEVTIDRDTIDGYIRAEMESTHAKTSTGKLLFEWMVPRAMKSMAADGRPLTLMLDSDTAGYPWELMEDHFDRRETPIAVDAGVIRQLVDKPAPDRPPLARTDRVCIIGDPKSYFKPLAAAKDEAAAACRKFIEAGWSEADVDCVIGDTGRIDEMINLERNRVFHFAGHGVQDWGEDKRTGLIIGKNRIFGPERVEQLRFAPEFVFLNCCHVGNAYEALTPDEAEAAEGKAAPLEARRARARLAANMAVSFISVGSKAVIAAGWEVGDGAAKAFADAFYDAFLDGQVFAEAVRQGRRAARKASPGQNTWGAYQCYGDPQYRLRRSSIPVDAARVARPCKTPGQATSVLQSLRADSRYAATQEARDRLETRLGEVRTALEAQPAWQDDPALFEAMGRVAAQLGRTEEAVVDFERALQCSWPGYSEEMVDRLWELRTRLATRARIAAERAGDGSARALMATERATLKEMDAHVTSTLTTAGPFGAWRRHARLGDTQLRLAAISTGAMRANYIAAAHMAYERAELSARERHARAAGHARIRMAFAGFLKGGARRLDDTGASIIKSILTETRDNADTLPTYENTRLLAEAKLFDLLNDGAISAQTHTQLIETFNTMFLSGASPGQRLETLGDLHTVASLMRARFPGVAAQIDRIIGDLQGSGVAPVNTQQSERMDA